MKKMLLLSSFLLFHLSASHAQHIGVNIRLDVSKSFKINSKIRTEISQQLQLNPEVKATESRYNNLFNDIYLFPGEEEEEDDDDDNDGDDDDGDGMNPDNPGDLNDGSQNIEVEWRSVTGVRGEYRPADWIRFSQNYSLNIREKDIRHGFRTDITLLPLHASKKFEIEPRLSWQMNSSEEDGQTVWNHSFVFRSGIEWLFKKDHRLYANPAANMELDRDALEWDRFRLDAGIKYRFRKKHTFDFGYRYQKRLTGKKKADSHGISIGYSVDF
ncbi:MAG: autotransporter outer membrane beta-barrel domain-containing protein [Saprospiraceae bacterium]